jgi:2-amino-4-hydroxy-6-hydroxymethyldihydropteridine diphosphokinase
VPDERCHHQRRMAQDKIAGREPATVFLGLGSNLGERHINLCIAVQLLSPQVNVEMISSFYETEPVGYLNQPRFINAVLKGTTSLSPRILLAQAKEVERILGRMPGFPNAPRPIDIDIIFYGDVVIDSPDLIVPHPRLEERAFVLVPLAEIAPDLVHPVNGKKVTKMLEKVGGLNGVKRWKQEARDV